MTDKILELNIMLKRTEEQRDLAMGIADEYKKIVEKQTQLISELMQNQGLIEKEEEEIIVGTDK